MIVAFEKSELVRHIGHLDLMRALHRALRRSGLPIRYSQGFNPHVLMSIASPLPVGVSGAEELFETSLDADVAEAVFLERLSIAMPHSLPVSRVRAVPDVHPKLMASLKSATYTAQFPRHDAAMAMVQAIPAYLARAEIPAIRKSKSGEKPCDIRPMLHELSADTSGEDVRLSFRVSLTETETLKPDLLLGSLAETASVALPEYRLHRTCLFAETNRQPVCLMEF